jgi:LysM repeat protein
MSVPRGTHLMYTVRPGDTLYSINNQFASSLETTIDINMLKPPFTEPDRIYPGQKLLIRLPGMAEESSLIHQVAAGDTMYRIAERYSVGLDMLASLNNMERPDILQVARLLYIPAFIYEVEPGDSLYRIARRYGTPMSDIVRANQGRPFFSPDLLLPGYRLVIPRPSSTNIVVFEPLPGSRVVAGTVLRGAARAFEATVLYQIVDAEGNVVTRETHFTTAAGAPVFGSFNVPLRLESAPATSTGTLMVYTRSARDGSIQDLVEVAVVF